MKTVRLIATLLGLLVGTLAHFYAKGDNAASSQGKSDTGSSSVGSRPVTSDWVWEDNGAALGPPFAPPSNSRLNLSKEARGRIVLAFGELMKADDYVEILESLAVEDPEYLFNLAKSEHSFPAMVAMRCYFSTLSDIDKCVSSLHKLADDSFWQNSLATFFGEVSLKPKAIENEQFVKFLGRISLDDKLINAHCRVLVNSLASLNLDTAADLISRNANLSRLAPDIPKAWARQKPLEAIGWVKFSGSAEAISTDSVRAIASAITETKSVENSKLLLDAIRGLPDTTIRESILEDSLLRMVQFGKPNEWQDELKLLPPSPKKDRIAYSLALQLISSGNSKENWQTWYQEHGASISVAKLSYISELSKKNNGR